MIKTKEYKNKIFELWIGFDLDGTLTEINEWKGGEYIGDNIPEMINTLKMFCEYGLEHGFKVKIFTARACIKSDIKYVKQWLETNNLGDLEVTNKKDHGCLLVFDDRSVAVNRNKGTFLWSNIINYVLDEVKKC